MSAPPDAPALFDTFCAVYVPVTGRTESVNAGHPPALLLRRTGAIEQLTEGGLAVGTFEDSTDLGPEDLPAVYSDGITDTGNPAGRPFDAAGLEAVLQGVRAGGIAAIGSAVVRAVEMRSGDVRLADDLTILLLRRDIAAAPVGVSLW